MKFIKIIFILLSANLIYAENSVSATLRNEKVPLFSKPNFNSLKLKNLDNSINYRIRYLNENTEYKTIRNGIWVNLIEPKGWVFSKYINIELENDENCSENFTLPAKFNFGSFDIILLNENVLFLSSFELGSSFNQQIGYWNWNNKSIEGKISFNDSTLVDCLNICYENENISSCKKNCKDETRNEFGKTNVTANLIFFIEFNKKSKTLKFKKINESNITKKSYLQYLGFEKNKLYKAECLNY
ncbi:hypothetical protein [Leptospira mtsangambouensis]|uniref:hypothetical protein n=1 Tax=Leptospira mtsangambouensis TaxID=2484912 RepID=UPI001EECAEBE|nr:hypothetical protein [Leptospira mtsangambouensis]MCG6142731.1 hypothetical protein [Leptospira mtsangambouensis]